MKKKCGVFYGIILVVLAVMSCRNESSRDQRSDRAKSPQGTDRAPLAFQPGDSSTYSYHIVNNTTTTAEPPSGTTKSINNSNTTVRYDIQKDSSGGYVMIINYEKIQVYLNKNGVETTMTAPANANESVEPAEKLLALLIGSPITVKISSAGKVINVKGYDEIVGKVMAQLTGLNGYSKSVAQQQLMSMVKEGLILKNIDQMLSIFPEGMTAKGDEWTVRTRQGGEFPMNVKTTFEVVDVKNNIFYLESSGTLKSDDSSVVIMGRSARTQLEGEQDGELWVDQKTGMLLSASSTSTIEGKVILQEHEIPVSIKGKVDIKGRKI